MSRRPTPAYAFASGNASSSSSSPSTHKFPPPSSSSSSHTPSRKPSNPFSNTPNAIPFSSSSQVDLTSHGRSSSIDTSSSSNNAQRSLFFPNTTTDEMRSQPSNPYSSMQRSGSSIDSDTAYSTNGGFAASPATERGSFLPAGAEGGSPRSSFAGAGRHLFSSSASSTRGSVAPTISEKFSLPSDPALWGADNVVGVEDDDYLHNPDPKRDRKSDRGGTVFTSRGLMNVGCLAILITGLLTLFAGYPIISAFTGTTTTTTAGFNLGGVNGSGQVPETVGSFGLIDADTPESAYTIVSDAGGTWDLVFSDEFNKDGRTFYSGDDPFWEADDLHAWSTGDLEWYDPRMITTANGSLVITLTDQGEHDLDYMGGKVSSWNKFCFTGGRLETSARLPGRADVYGLWPAFWTMGNLGRAGYGGTLDGMWPYSYDECDDTSYYGTLPNQTHNELPAIALTSGNGYSTNYSLSYLPGQRLSRCVCPDDDTHPGPKHSDGTWVGRSAPEIDVFEAQTDNYALIGQVSQSGQFAPFNPYYEWNNATYMDIVNASVSALNTYQGGVYQQSTSVVSTTNQNCYEQRIDGSGEEGCFAVYAFEYKTGTDGYITWFNDDKKMWTYSEGGMEANTEALVGNRKVPDEPMYIIMNLALSLNFGAISDFLTDLYPVHMYFDYVRVYQDPELKNIGCDPVDRPTSAYIERYATGYADPNITTWDQMTDSAALPINKYTGTC